MVFNETLQTKESTMNKNQKILASAVLVVGLTVVVAVTKWQSWIQDIEGRFPEIDRKILRKAYRKFMTNSALGKYNDLDLDVYDDEQMDVLFMREVNKLTYHL